MSEGRADPPGAGLTPAGGQDAAGRAGGDEREPGDGALQKIDVRPEDVWQPGPPPPAPRWAQRSFFAPVLRVIAISALLLYGMIAVGGALWAWLR